MSVSRFFLLRNGNPCLKTLQAFRVVEQKTLSYKENLEKYSPTYVVHGDEWASGFQKSIRDEVVSMLASYGGQLVEFPYAREEKYA